MTAINIPFRLGREPDIAISDGNGIRLVTAGIVSHIYMVSDMAGARILLVSDDIETILASGNSTEIAETYSRLVSDLLSRRKSEFSLQAVLLSVAVTAVLAMGLFSAAMKEKDEALSALVARLHSTTSQQVVAPLKPFLQPEAPMLTPRPAAQPGSVPGAAGRPSFEEMRESMRKAYVQNEQDRAQPAQPPQPAGPTLSPSQANALAAGLAGLKAGTQILPRPDFLKLPSTGETPEVPTAPVPAPQAAPDKLESEPKNLPEVQAKSVPKEEASLDLDAVTSAFDQAGKDAAATMHTAPRPENTAPVSKSETTPTASAPAPATPAGQMTPKAAEAPPAAASTQKSAVEPKDASPIAPAAPVKDTKAEAPPATGKAIDKQALSEAVGKVVKGMTQEQAMGIVGQLTKLDGGEITEDMLAGLPHEVAAMLKEAGLVTPSGDDENAPGGVPYRIIRLPEPILEKHRGKDGIANVPGRDTWSATGNFVRLPLPGGGDIRSPEVFKSFGLNP